MLLFLTAFASGLLASLSACVYPLIPITAAIFAGGERKSWSQGFHVAGVYVTGMALTYGVLGMVAALSGSVFGAYLASPNALVAISAVLIYLGLAYAHLVPLPMPNFANRLQAKNKNPILYPLVLGIFSAFIAAPCTAPFFGSLLVQISRNAAEQHSIFVPSLAAFAFAFGMGLPFLLIGAFSIRLPKPGLWLKAVEYVGAVVLITMGFHYLEDISGDFPPANQTFPFAIIGLGLTVTFFLLAEPLKKEPPMTKRAKLNTAGMLLLSGLGFFLFTTPFAKYWGVDVKTNTGAQSDVPHRTAMTLPEGRLKWYKDLNEAKAVASKEGKILFIDFWADWCTACEQMERKLFTQEDFIDFAIEKRILPVRIDFSNPTDALDKLAKDYNIRGLPTVVLTKADGELIHTMMGFYSKEYSMRELKMALKSQASGDN